MNGTPVLVNDVMTHRVVALRAGAAFKDIVKVMREWRVSALPVRDDRGRVAGVSSRSQRGWHGLWRAWWTCGAH